MENRFTLRRGDTPPSTENLMEYELGWDKQGKRLYMNDGGESVSLMMHEDEIVQLIYERTFNWIYPVGSLYWSMNNTDPSTLFPGTTWEQIQNRFIYAVGADTQSGELGGATDGKITLDEGDLPAHSHLVSGDTSSVTGSTSQQPDHGHSVGSYNVYGSFELSPATGGGVVHRNFQDSGYHMWESASRSDVEPTTGVASGGFSVSGRSGYTTTNGFIATVASGADRADEVTLNATSGRGFSGTSGTAGGHSHTINAHDHSISIETSETGESKSFSIMPPYITAYCWKRIS